jgi:hypothetical protein
MGVPPGVALASGVRLEITSSLGELCKQALTTAMKSLL